MRKRQGGFIDPLSLISLGFLVVSLLVGAVVVNKQNANYDIRNKAATCMEPCQNDSDCETNEYCYIPATGCPVCKIKTTPVTTPSCNTGNCYNDCICNNNPVDLCNESCNPSTNSATTTNTPIPTSTPTPACGGLYDPCCGAYPSGSCNSGLYCSNMDGGTCLISPTPTPQTCSGCSTMYKYCHYTYQSTTNCTNYQDAVYTKDCSCTAGTQDCPVNTSSCQSTGIVCCPINFTAGAINTCAGISDREFCESQSVCDWLTSCSTPTPIPTIPPGICCPKNNSASAINTCNKASYNSCLINTSVCEWKTSCTAPTPTPTPSYTCSGTCQWGYSACNNGGWQNATGTCPSGSICCGAALVDNCTQGLSYCVSSTTVAICKSDKSGYTFTPCDSNAICDSGENRCIPAPANVITQADCDQCLQNNTPSECSGVCQNIGGTITTPLGQQECVPGTQFCNNGNLKICSTSGTWGLQTCSFGCENNSCKKPLLAIGELCNSGSECQSGYCYAETDSPATTMGLNPGGLNLPSLAGTQPRCHAASFEEWQNIGNAAIAGNLIGTGIVAAGLVVAVAPQTAVSVATLLQGPLAIITCQTQGADSAACQLAAAGITAGFFSDPIGTLQGLQTSAQQVQQVAQSGLDELLSFFQNSGTSIQQALENYMVSYPPPNYTSILYEQTEVLGQPMYNGNNFVAASDAELAAAVDNILQALGNPAEYADGMSVDDIAQAVYNNYPATTNNLPAGNLIASTGTSSPYGVAPLGAYFNPLCPGNVCYENSILTQAVASTFDENTLIINFFDDATHLGNGHSAILFLDNGVLSVTDPTWNVSGTLADYIQFLQNNLGYSSNITFTTEQIFIPAP